MYTFAKQLTGLGRGIPAVAPLLVGYKSIHNLHNKSFKITTYITKKSYSNNFVGCYFDSYIKILRKK